MSAAEPPNPPAAPPPAKSDASPPLTPSRKRHFTELATTAGVVFVLVAVGFALLNLAWLRDLREPRVVLLGSGDRISVLVLAGDARLLIATGDDAVAFGNALERQRRPAQRRLDLAFVAGAGNDLLAPAAVAADPNVRLLAALVPFADAPDEPALRGLPALSGPRRVTLGDGMAVTLEPAQPSGDDERAAWRAIVERGDSRVVILSDGAAADRFPPPPLASVLVVAGGRPLDAWSAAPTTVLAHADAAIPGRALRETAASGAPVPRYDVRIHPGDSVPLRFVEGGIELPPDAAVALGAPPANATPDAT